MSKVPSEQATPNNPSGQVNGLRRPARPDATPPSSEPAIAAIVGIAASVPA